MSTLCFSGMDRAEEAKLKEMLKEANSWMGGDWHVVPEAQAQVMVVDVDSIYGHMTWLKMSNSSKYVVALSARADSEADHVLVRPVTVDGLVDALTHAASGTRASNAPAQPAPQPQSAPPPAQTAPPTPQPAQQPASPRAAAPPQPAPAAPAAPPRPAPPPARSRDPVLWDFLQAGGLQGPSLLEIEGAPSLVIDPRTDTYIGGTSLKPYLPYFDLGALPTDRWRALSGAELNQQLAVATNESHPLARLRWLYSLVQGAGELAPGYDVGDKFRLTRWPKTEREFPRHMRIATAMMQEPATAAEIAAKSDVALADVNDFINASLDSGFAEPVAETPASPTTNTKSGGLLGRLRGLRNG